MTAEVVLRRVLGANEGVVSWEASVFLGDVCVDCEANTRVHG